MRSSSTINAEITQVKAEMASLKTLRYRFLQISLYIKDISRAFVNAGEYIEISGKIEGKFIDGGKTRIQGNEFSTVSSNIESLMDTLNSTIDTMENKLKELQAEYEAAVAAEKAAAEEARRNNMLKAASYKASVGITLKNELK